MRVIPFLTLSNGGSFWMGSPLKRMVPVVVGSSPAMVFTRVVLPAPLGPIMLTISFGWMLKEMSQSTWIMPYAAEIFWTWSILVFSELEFFSEVYFDDFLVVADFVGFAFADFFAVV